MTTKKAQLHYSFDNYPKEEYYSNDEYFTNACQSEHVSCAICGSEYTYASFKGMLVCESCLESVRRYCY